MASRRSHIASHPPWPGEGEPRQRHGHRRDERNPFCVNGLAFIRRALGVRVAEKSCDGRAVYESRHKSGTQRCQTKPICVPAGPRTMGAAATRCEAGLRQTNPIFAVCGLKSGSRGKPMPIYAPAGGGDVRQPLSRRAARACRRRPAQDRIVPRKANLKRGPIH